MRRLAGGLTAADKRRTVRTIGIAGTQRGVGATHLAIMLANYLVSKENRRTAVVEMNSEGIVKRLKNLYEYAKEEEPFCLYGADYYAMPDARKTAELFQLDYEYILMDFGSEGRNQNYEWPRCGFHIIVGNASEWNMDYFRRALAQNQNRTNLKRCHIASLFGISEVREELQKDFGIRILKIPFEENPFLLHKGSFSFLKHLIQEDGNCQ